MHKNIDILQACGALEDKVERCNDRIKTSSKHDLTAMDSGAKNAMKKFTDHVNNENVESANKIGKMIIDMEQIEKRASKNLTEQNKAVDKLKSEVK
jgi:ribosomal protein S20